MPKKRRSEGKGKIIPLPSERFPWKCDVKGCPIKGKAATKADAQLAKLLHKGGAH